MNEPVITFSHEFSVVLACPHRDNEVCDIPLPRQSQLGMYGGRDYQPTGDWQEMFLCLRHGQAFACSAREVRLEIQVRAPHQPVSSLWQIDAECAREGCGK